MEDMTMRRNLGMSRAILVVSLAMSVMLTPLLALAQGTGIPLSRNKYTLQQDVQLGRQAADEIRRQLPLLNENSEADRYVESVGRRLVAAIPREYQQPA